MRRFRPPRHRLAGPSVITVTPGAFHRWKRQGERRRRVTPDRVCTARDMVAVDGEAMVTVPARSPESKRRRGFSEGGQRRAVPTRALARLSSRAILG